MAHKSGRKGYPATSGHPAKKMTEAEHKRMTRSRHSVMAKKMAKKKR